jgi:DNA repair exonuclease SbcCD ATPase subunit
MLNHTYIKVYWDDILDNYTRARELEIQRYFEKKYKARANVVFRPIRNASSSDMKGIQADATDQVMDIQYQRKLMKKYIQDNQIEVNWEHLIKLDDTVNSKIESSKELNMRYKKFDIDQIILNNFLSYADKDQVLELEQHRGLNVVKSAPQNKAGKTSGIVDALLFVFFGKTTKTDTLEEAFNKYTDTDKVSVKAAIKIDGERYMIERLVTRTLKRDKSGYNVKSSVEFYLPAAEGGWERESLKGERRQATDKKITEYIGGYDDFLLTIITTIKNFYSLIESKPTERGRIFTRFIGVEILAEKAEMAKSMQSEWIKTSKLSTTNLAKVEQEIVDETSKLDGYKVLADAVKLEVVEVENKIATQEKDVEIATLKKHQNVDEELYKVREEDILDGIGKLEVTITNKSASIETLKHDLVAPEQVFDVDTYNAVKLDIQDYNNDLSAARTKKTMAERTLDQLKNGEFCPTCKRPLEGVDHSAEIAVKTAEVLQFGKEIATLNDDLSVSNVEIAKHEAVKEAWTTYDKAKLVIERNEVELEVYRGNLKVGKEKLEKYRNNKTSIEANRLLDTKIASLKRQLNELKEDREGKMLSLKGYEKDIEVATATMNRLIASKKDVVRDEIINKIYLTYIAIFGKNGISKMILGTMIPILNSYLNQMMFDTVPFKLEIRLNDKNEVEFWMVDDEGDVEKRLMAGSGYESTISLLALRCVLSKVCSLPKPNIVVFDEVFGQVGDENMPLLGAFFERMKEYFDSIFIITHNPVMLDWADNIINVKKINNLTYLSTDEVQPKKK